MQKMWDYKTWIQWLLTSVLDSNGLVWCLWSFSSPVCTFNPLAPWNSKTGSQWRNENFDLAWTLLHKWNRCFNTLNGPMEWFWWLILGVYVQKNQSGHVWFKVHFCEILAKWFLNWWILSCLGCFQKFQRVIWNVFGCLLDWFGYWFWKCQVLCITWEWSKVKSDFEILGQFDDCECLDMFKTSFVMCLRSDLRDLANGFENGKFYAKLEKWPKVGK